LLTAAHATRYLPVTVPRRSGTPLPAMVVKQWADSDTAVIYVTGYRGNDPAKVGTDEPKIGESIWWKGYPGGQPQHRKTRVTARTRDRSKYWFGGSVEPGASGGPIFDSDGVIRGVVSAVATDRSVNESVAGDTRHVAEWLTIATSPVQMQCANGRCYPIPRPQSSGFSLISVNKNNSPTNSPVYLPQQIQPRPDPQFSQPRQPTAISAQCQALIAAEIARQIAARPVARGADGINGRDGKDGRSVTQADIQTILDSLRTHVDNNADNFRGPKGDTGDTDVTARLERLENRTRTIFRVDNDGNELDRETYGLDDAFVIEK